MAPQPFRIERLTGVPAARVEAIILIYKADPEYISHTTRPEDNPPTLYTIEVRLKAV
jgi:hypothetical protein